MSDFAIPTCPHCEHELKGRPLRGTCPNCRAEYSLNLPGLEPGRMPPTSRYQRFEYDAGLGRRALLKSAALTVISLCIIAGWKAADAEEDGTQEAVNFLIRYAISFSAALGIYLLCCATGIIEYCGPLLRAALGVAGSLAAALLAQHVTAEGTLLLGVPWLVGLLVFLGLTADLLELDLTEATLLAIFVLGARVMLKFTLFDHMFAK